ncbi:WD40-repeat-containing domain protein [Mortierella sp. GBAus27b]|nr:hypothetical protein BGX31_000062 [Mortierella sp. GBA43]KAI8357964.1 WD40-repeat-containing domain protein [Mortierella sp. GBAus27b]
MKTRSRAKPVYYGDDKDSEDQASGSDHEEVKEEEADEDPSSQPTDDSLTEYERLRLENIRRNQEAMRMFELPEAASALSRSLPSANKRPAPTPGVKREKRPRTTEHAPRRTSNRLAKLEPDGPEAKKLDEYRETTSSMEHRRVRRSGTLSLSDASNGNADDSRFAKMLEEMSIYVPDKARVKDAEDESDNDNDDSESASAVNKEDPDTKEQVKEEAKEDVKAEVKDEGSEIGIKKYFKPRRSTVSASSAPAASPTPPASTRASTPAASTPTRASTRVSTPAASTSTPTRASTRASAASAASAASPASAYGDTTKASQPTTTAKPDKEPSLRRKIQALKIKGPWPTVKVCQGRIYCMAIHENKDKVLVCGGDIDGNLGFWDLDESLAEDYQPDYDEEPNTYSYTAHTRTLSSMQYSPTDPTKLFTTSYDGSVRYLDLVKRQFVESYVVSPDVSDHLGSISINAKGQQLWFADNDGGVTLKDIRTPKDEMIYRKVLHEKKVGCVNVNPKHDHLIVTSSLDRTMKIWDVRTFGKYKRDEPIAEIAEFPHGLSVTSAMWSPDGASIASTSYDDNVRIFNNFDPALPNITEIPEPVRIPHNNQSGRWVTMLRAVWAFQFNWFSIGNMRKAVDIYSRGTGDLMASLRDPAVLTTVPAVNAWHPNRVLLASGMANGKMVIWR